MSNRRIIHGHTKIELKNVKTGLKDIIESDNTFQDTVLTQFLSTNGDNCHDLFSNNTFRAEPWKYLMGGLLLFHDEIQVGKKFMPAGNYMIGKGAWGIENNGTPSELGSFNSLESTSGPSSITQVYDFTTSQANGRIACVALTSREGGLVGYGNRSLGKYTGQRYNIGRMTPPAYTVAATGAVGVLAKNDNRYVITGDGTNITVTEYVSTSLTGSVFTGKAKTYTFPASDYPGAPSHLIDGYFDTCYCGNNIIRWASNNGGVSPVASMQRLYYMEFDCEQKTLELKSVINATGMTLGIRTNYYDNKQNNFLMDNKMVCFAGGYYPVVIDLNDGSLVFNGADAYGGSGWDNSVMQIGPGLYVFGGDYPKIYDAVRNAYAVLDAAGIEGHTSCAFDDDVVGAYQTGGRNYDGYYSSLSYVASHLIHLPMYLATINNITPVIKDATQTMKVTYTIEEA